MDEVATPILEYCKFCVLNKIYNSVISNSPILLHMQLLWLLYQTCTQFLFSYLYLNVSLREAIGIASVLPSRLWNFSHFALHKKLIQKLFVSTITFHIHFPFPTQISEPDSKIIIKNLF